MEEFDYCKAMAELEKIVEQVEDSSSPLDEIDKHIKRSSEIVAQCREYLRSERSKIDKL